jgi:biopolymer transport protein ExbB/TolQ
MKKSYLNLGLVLAIALVIASNRLQRHTGVAASDWRKELMEQALAKFNSWSIEKVQRFIAQHYD